ncbi:MAG: hypothetical protein RSC00_00880 [Ruthenibacterium sp.]
MSLLQTLAAHIGTMAAARQLAPNGVLLGPAGADAVLTLCDEGEQRAECDIGGSRTAVRAYALYFRTVLLTQSERALAQSLCEMLCAQLNAAPLPAAQADDTGSLQDLHCGGVQTTSLDDSGRCTWRVPLWVEVR